MIFELGAPVILRPDEPGIWHLAADAKRTLDHCDITLDEGLRRFVTAWPPLCDPRNGEVWVYGDLVRQRRLCQRCARLNGGVPLTVPRAEREAIAAYDQRHALEPDHAEFAA